MIVATSINLVPQPKFASAVYTGRIFAANYSGSHEEIRRYALFGVIASAQYNRWKGFAESCMAEYNLDGWTTKDLINPDNVAVVR